MTDEMEWDPMFLELPGSIRSTYELSNARFIQKVRHDIDNEHHRDCI